MKDITSLPLSALLQAAGQATRNAARDAVAAGRIVTGVKDGHLAEYGPDALPLAPTSSVEESVDVKVA